MLAITRHISCGCYVGTIFRSARLISEHRIQVFRQLWSEVILYKATPGAANGVLLEGELCEIDHDTR